MSWACHAPAPRLAGRLWCITELPLPRLASSAKSGPWSAQGHRTGPRESRGIGEASRPQTSNGPEMKSLAAKPGEGLCPATGAKFLKALPTITLAGLIAAAALLPAAPFVARRGHGYFRRGRDFPYPIFLRWADAYQKETEIVVNYYQIGSGAGVRHVQFQIVALRRLRHAAQTRSARERRPNSVSKRDRRHRCSCEPRGHQVRRHQAGRGNAGENFSRRGHDLE